MRKSTKLYNELNDWYTPFFIVFAVMFCLFDGVPCAKVVVSFPVWLQIQFWFFSLPSHIIGELIAFWSVSYIHIDTESLDCCNSQNIIEQQFSFFLAMAAWAAVELSSLCHMLFVCIFCALREKMQLMLKVNRLLLLPHRKP